MANRNKDLYDIEDNLDELNENKVFGNDLGHQGRKMEDVNWKYQSSMNQ